MMATDGSRLALKVLEKLSRYYLAPGIEEIAMNRECEVWIKPRREPWHAREAPELTYDYVRQVCRVLSNINQSRFSEDELPVVSCELPGQPFRFQAMMGPNVRYELTDMRGIALAIRVLTADSSIKLTSWLDPNATLEGLRRFVEQFDMTADHFSKIARVIELNQTILVSGSTSTGKTTFANQLIGMIDRSARVVTVEDGGRELTVPHRNRVHLLVQRNQGTTKITWDVVINALMRMTPDWIVCGEVSMQNAAAIVNLMGKGHPVITTVHAGTPDEAMQAFVNNMSATGSRLDPLATIETMKGQIGCIIQLDRRDGKRKVVDITFPAQERNTRLVLEREEELRELEERMRKLKGEAPAR